MRKYILVLVCLLVPLLCGWMSVIQLSSTAQTWDWFFGNGFETATERGEWTDYGSPDKAFSASGLNMTGDYVVELDNGEAVVYNWTAEGTVYCVGQTRYTDAVEQNRLFFNILHSSNSIACGIGVGTTGDVGTWDGNSQGSAATIGYDPDETWWFQVYYQKSTGSGSTCWFKYYTDGTGWSSIQSSQTDTNTNDSDGVRFPNNQNEAAEDQYADQVFCGTTEFLGNPNNLKR
jgi:hypothetical protein